MKSRKKTARAAERPKPKPAKESAAHQQGGEETKVLQPNMTEPMRNRRRPMNVFTHDVWKNHNQCYRVWESATGYVVHVESRNPGDWTGRRLLVLFGSDTRPGPCSGIPLDHAVMLDEETNLSCKIGADIATTTNNPNQDRGWTVRVLRRGHVVPRKGRR